MTGLIDDKPNIFSVEKHCFKEQIDFIRDKARRATAVCSVRAGKTTACAADLIDTAITFPGTTGLYTTLTRLSAKRIVWPELLNINRLYSLGGIPNETELYLKFPNHNNSIIYLTGANNANEIEKIRGLSNVALAYTDESQLLRAYIKELVEDILAKRLYDTNGRLRMIGTPGPVPAGYFFDTSKNPKWSHHEWTLHQNPWIERKSGMSVSALIAQDCELKGVSLNDPSIQRECFGKWVIDLDALVFKYDPRINDYDVRPHLNHPWNYVIGVDLGSNGVDRDNDAIAVVGWSEYDKNAYLVEEDIGGSLGITDLTSKLEKLVHRYNPMKIVMDTGGLGKKIADELTSRFSIPLTAAEKSRKFEYIEILNDAMRTAHFFAKKDSQFAGDCALIEWERDPEKPGKLKISNKFHSDVNDAVLYSYREALHWLSEPEVIKPKKGTREWQKAEAEAMEQLAEEAHSRKVNPEEADLWADVNEAWQN